MTPTDVHTVACRVHGLVLGVFFRASSLKCSIGLKLTGTVRNCWDNTLEIVAYGLRSPLSDLIAWARAGGPPGAPVAKVEFLTEISEMRGEDVPCW